MTERSFLARLGSALAPERKSLQPIAASRRGWRVLEPFTGAWQRNVEVNRESVMANHAVFACMTLIASDIAKLRVKLVRQNPESRVWAEVDVPAFSPVLRKPNPYQTRIQFWESWMLSLLSSGNTYALKVRDGRRAVIGLHVLDPQRVTPLVSEGGEVFYQLKADNLPGLAEGVTVPAREIIHDRMNCLFHPLVGLSPIFAAGVAATQGLRIQENSANFFANQSMPGGLLIAPEEIADTTAQELKEYWAANFSGRNAGKIAVLGDNMRYERLAVNAHDAQLVEQLKWSAEVVCSTFHVPPYKIGVGQQPSHNNVQSLNIEYYTQCLQVRMEAAELCLDEGLGTGPHLGTEFDIDGLLRMDSITQLDVLDKAKSVLTLDERRKRLDVEPLKVGGSTVYLQQQDHSVEAIAARDAQLIEQAKSPPEPAPAPAPDPAANDNTDEEAADALDEIRRGLS